MRSFCTRIDLLSRSDLSVVFSALLVSNPSTGGWGRGGVLELRPGGGEGGGGTRLLDQYLGRGESLRV